MNKPAINPWMLYGTAWKEEATQDCVERALSAGFRGFDTANQRKHYHEAGVGAALKAWIDQGKLKREELFLQTKYTFISSHDERLPYDPEASPAEQVRQSFASSLEHLHTDYLDSYVLHGPSRWQGLAEADWEAWRAMELLHRQGKVKYLGISNVDGDQLSALCDGVTIKPTFVQNRCYAHRAWDREVRTLCTRHAAIYQGFSLLTANKHLDKNPDFMTLTEHEQHTPAQVIFRFAQQLGMLPLTGTRDSEHMRQDLECSQFSLSQAQMDQIETISA